MLSPRILPVLLALCAVATTLSLRADPLPPVPTGHPRLLVSAADLPRLRASEQDPALQPIWTELRRRASLPADHRPEPRYDLAVMRAAEAAALLALVHDDPSEKRAAIALAHRLLGDSGPAEKPTYFERQAIGRCLSVVAQVYDWCYDALTPAERTELCRMLRAHSSSLEMGFPPRVPGSIAGHSSGMQLLRDMFAMALAIADEDPEVYEIIAGKFYREYAPAREFVYPGHAHHQGNAYGAGRFGGEIWSALWLQGVESGVPWSLSAMGQVPYFYLYLRRPDGGMIKDGDDYYGSTRPLGSYWSPPAHHWLHYTALFRDPQFAAQWRRQLQTVETKFQWHDDPVDPVLQIIFRPDQVESAAQADLPLSRYFPSPMGAIVARTGWNVGPSSRDAVAYLKIGTHRFDNHQHADSGQFQLFYRGSLAIDSGMYASTTGAYGSAHFANYFRRTVAHNALLIEEPSESFTFAGRPIANDGGQRALEGAFDMEEFWEQSSRTAHVTSVFIGPNPQAPEVSLIKGDLTPAYSDEKARHVSRTMAFLPLDRTEAPAVLVVLDRVESVRADQRKVALLHSVEEPRVTGNVATVTRTTPQIEILRWAPATLENTSASEATLAFDLSGLQGRKVIQAELYCRVPWSRSGSVEVWAGDQRLAEASIEKEELPLPNVTAWLHRSLKQHSGSGKLIVRRQGGDGRGVFDTYEGPQAPHLRVWVETEPANGQLVQTTLLPRADDLDIRKIGGPGQEFVAGGQNFPATPNIPEPMAGVEAGAWRLEIGDKSGSAATQFLQVYQVMDTGATPSPVRAVEASGLIGAAIDDRLFLASADRNPVPAGASFVIAEQDAGADGRALVILTDLPPGDHALWEQGALCAMMSIEAPGHTFVTRLRPGTYLLKSR